MSKTTSTPPFNIRPKKPEDMGFIYNSFHTSFRKGPVAGLLPNETYSAIFCPLMENLLFQKNVNVDVMVNPDDTNHIYGWIASEVLGQAKVVHYVLVKEVFQGAGLARELLSSVGIKWNTPFFYTLLSQEAYSFRRKYVECVYQPYILFQPKFLCS